MSPTNVEIARRGYEAALRGDLSELEDFLDPNVKWHAGDPTAEGACRNRGEALEFMRQARQRGPIGQLVEIVDAGDEVVVIMRPVARGGEEPALTANLTTFRDGRAVEMVHYPRAEDALAAAGVSRQQA